MPKPIDIFSANERLNNPITRNLADSITIEKLIQIGRKVDKQNLPEETQTIILQKEIMSYLYGAAIQ